jgi:hypothetical protein
VQNVSQCPGVSLMKVSFTPSVEGGGSALDNAAADGFVSTLKAELASNLVFPSRQAANTTIFGYLECSTTPAVCTRPGATEVPQTSKKIESEKPASRKVNVSVTAGESQPDVAPVIRTVLPFMTYLLLDASLCCIRPC